MAQPSQATVGWYPGGSSEGAQHDGAPGAHSSYLLTNAPLAGFSPFPVSPSPLPHLYFLGSPPQINYLRPNPGLRICVEGTETKPPPSARLLPQASCLKPRLISWS